MRPVECPALLALCEGNPPMTSGFPSQRASNVERFSMSRSRHELHVIWLWVTSLRQTSSLLLWGVHCGSGTLTHLSLEKMAANQADDIFNCIFLNEHDRILIQISLKYVPRSPIDNKTALVQVMAWRRTGDKPLPGPMMTQFIHHIFDTRGRWVYKWGVLQLSSSIFPMDTFLLPLNIPLMLWQNGCYLSAQVSNLPKGSINKMPILLFSNVFSWMKMFVFDWNFIEVCYSGCNWEHFPTCHY